MMFRRLSITLGLALATSTMAGTVSMVVKWDFGDTLACTISDSNKWAWSETTGWINFSPKTSGWYDHVVYHTTSTTNFFSGYAWGENIGWIRMGVDANGPFANSSTNNWGVNVDAKGACSGYAYSSQAGWINFKTAYTNVTMHPTNGVFDGYAWGENVGWIHFRNDATPYKVQRGTTPALRMWWLTQMVDPPGFVSVVNAGNDDCSYEDANCGGVDYEYRMGECEITAGQYAIFLNAVATDDPHGLYNPQMWDSDFGCKIERHGEPGEYSYSVADDRAARPVNFVSWGDAARFANWLSNGQPIGPQDPATTEDGSYALHGALTDPELMAVTRKMPAEGGRFFIPSEDEWYKAAYYDPEKPGGPGYWRYPTVSDEAPANDLVRPDPGNSANFLVEPDDYTLGAPYYTTECGAFSNSASHYGTLDQGGNVWEWNATLFEGDKFGLRGGAYDSPERDLNPARDYKLPTTEAANIGFRLSEISMLSGRVFAGDVGVETTPLAGVTVSLYGSSEAYLPDTNNFIASTTTDTNGWYQLNASGNWSVFQIHETDPAGHFSAGATTVSGRVVSVNCITMEAPLSGKPLTGNKFWDKPGDTQAADLNIELIRNWPAQGLLSPGSNVQYAVVLRNFGSHTSHNAVVTLELPWQIDYVAADISPVVVSNDPDVLQWPLAYMEPVEVGHAVIFVVQVDAVVRSEATGSAVSTASVTSTTPDYHQQNNSCTHTDTVAGERVRDMGDEKWLQPPDLTSSGIDVRVDRYDGTERLMADDFRCTNIATITGVDLWGSWSNDYRPGQIQSLHLAFYADVPSNESPYGYSIPGNLLWQRDFAPGEFVEEQYYRLDWEDYEWWWDPDNSIRLPNGDRQVWRVSVTNLDFIQYGSTNDPAVYWLGAWAELSEGGRFGWKTSSNHWNDSAVRWDMVHGEWRELRYPPAHPAHSNAIDLAFALYEGPVEIECADLEVTELSITLPTNTPIAPGTQVLYEFEAVNNGPSVASNTVLTFELPLGMSSLHTNGLISTNPDVLQLTLSAVMSNSTIVGSVWAEVASNASGVVTARLTAVSDTLDTLPHNNTAEHASLIGLLDFGVATDSANFPTLLADNGARHVVVSNFCLGVAIDAETNGLPNATSSGDDENGTDDEDGVTFTSLLILGGPPLTVDVVASQSGVLDAWVDFAGDGTWNNSDRVFTNQALTAGTNHLAFAVPQIPHLGGVVVSRFRFSSHGVSSYDGLALDGEVEDYVTPQVALLDYGDGYGSTLSSDGPRHAVTNPATGLWLGDATDSPDADIDGDVAESFTKDDVTIIDDENGVFVPQSTDDPGGDYVTNLTVIVNGGGYVDAWIDLDQDGVWEPLGGSAGPEKVHDAYLPAGTNAITVPALPVGRYASRFRISAQGNLGLGGVAMGGEVEDHMLVVEEAPTPMLQGRVFRGTLGIETNPLAGVTVSLYGSLNPYPDMGTFVTNTVTDTNGWYGLRASGWWDFYHIVEADPTGHTSVGATSVDGAIKTDNWIEYTHPLAGKTLTGNKFWDEPAEPTNGWLEGMITDYELPGTVPPCTAATVWIDPGGLVVPADPTNGYYGPVALTAGVYNVTASAPGYSTQTVASIGIVDEVTTTQDFALQRPVIDAWPLSFTGITVVVNEVVTNYLTITNSGHKVLAVEVTEETGSVPTNVPWCQQDPIMATLPVISGNLDFDIVFACTTVGVHTCTLRIIHNDPAEGAIVIPVEVNCVAGPEPEPTLTPKWVQSPDPEAGLDIQSWGLEYGSQSGTHYRVADDWLCDGRSIDGLCWWGSYIGMASNPPPSDIRPNGFVLRWYTDIAATESNHSMPGALLEEVFVPLASQGATNAPVGTVLETFEFTVDLSQMDPRPDPPLEHEYMYHVKLSKPWLEKEGNVYWLSVEARYESVAPSNGVWGWATADPGANWNDDAVLSRGEKPPVWDELVYPPQVAPWSGIVNHPYAGESVNMAFELLTDVVGRRAKKWAQGPDMVEGVNMASWRRDGQTGVLRADDFVHDGRRVTDIHWWGSYIGWHSGITGNDTNPVAPPTGANRPIGFDLSWHTHGPGYPEGGESFFVPIAECHEMYFGTVEQDWLGTNRYEHEYRYYVDLLSPEVAMEPWDDVPEGEPGWLNVQAVFPDEFLVGEHEGWGWTINDDVRQEASHVSTNPGTAWSDTFLPVGHPHEGEPFDLAFELTTDEVGVEGPHRPVEIVDVRMIDAHTWRIETIGDYGSGAQVLQAIRSLTMSNWTDAAVNPLPLPPPYRNVWYYRPEMSGSRGFYRIRQR